MAAKQSAEMRNALRLVAQGVPVKAAAETCGVFWTSVYQSLQKQRKAAAVPQPDKRNYRREDVRKADATAARAILKAAGWDVEASE